MVAQTSVPLIFFFSFMIYSMLLSLLLKIISAVETITLFFYAAAENVFYFSSGFKFIYCIA